MCQLLCVNMRASVSANACVSECVCVSACRCVSGCVCVCACVSVRAMTNRSIRFGLAKRSDVQSRWNALCLSRLPRIPSNVQASGPSPQCRQSTPYPASRTCRAVCAPIYLYVRLTIIDHSCSCIRPSVLLSLVSPSPIFLSMHRCLLASVLKSIHPSTHLRINPYIH